MPSLRFIKLPPGMQSFHIAEGQEFVFDPSVKMLKIGRNSDWPRGLKEEATMPGPNSRIGGVSREHFAIVCERGRYYIEDLRSQNGTYSFDSKLVPHLRYPLNDGFLISMSTFLFQFIDENNVPKSDSAIKLILEAIGCRYSILTQHPLAKPETVFDFLLALPESLEHNDPLSQVGKKIIEQNFFPKATHCFFHGVDTQQQPHTIAGHPRQTSPTVPPSVILKYLEQGEAIIAQLTDESSTTLDNPRSSSMFVPLYTQDQKPIGVLHLHAHHVENAFTESDLARLIGLGGLISKFVEKSGLTTRFLHPNSDPRLGNTARSVQRLMMPQTFPSVPKYEFSVMHQAPKQLGGDFFDGFTLSNGMHVFLVGKILGRGIASALLMARFTGHTRQAFQSTANTAEAMTKLNRIWFETPFVEWAICLTVFVLDPVRHTLEYANAGNLKPLIYRSHLNTFETLDHSQHTGLAIGLIEDETYQTSKLSFYPGDCLLAFNNGIVDAQDSQGRPFTAEVVQSVALDCIDRAEGENFVSATRLGQTLTNAVANHCGDEYNSQSFAMITFSRLPIPADVPSVVTVENAK